MARDRTRKQIRDALLDELLESCDGPEDVLGKDGLIRQLTGRLVERVLDAELTDHLGYDKHSSAGNGSGNSRNGYRKKTLRDDDGEPRPPGLPLISASTQYFVGIEGDGPITVVWVLLDGPEGNPTTLADDVRFWVGGGG
ncbi:MAG: transposase, partial [Candidatus Poribacteria bacterium]